MTPAQHTPGPWPLEVDANQWPGVVAEPIGVGAVLLEPPRQPRPRLLIARVHGGATFEESKAIGWLLAAAPDLLAACEMALPAVQFAFTEVEGNEGHEDSQSEFSA